MEKYKILIIDDSVDNLKILVSIFEEFQPSYEVFQTNNPEHAIQIAKQTLPNLIITDWNMPNISGIELIGMLKQEVILKDIPVIMATGIMLSNNDLQLAFKAGAIDYIRKPIDATELIARTNSALTLASYYNQIVEQKNKDLTETSLHLIKGQKLNKSFASKIEHLKKVILKNPSQAIDELNELEQELEQSIEEEGWYRFNLSFSKVHEKFNKNLTEKHPNLTPSELKLCAFIRLGMANKEIASVLNQTYDSVKVSRYRIRKKIDMGECGNLEAYISQF